LLRKIAAAGDDSQNGPGDGYPHRYVGFRRVQIVFSNKQPCAGQALSPSAPNSG